MGGVRRRVGLAGHELGAQGRVGCQHAMEANEMESRTWDERGQALQEFQWGHHEMGGAISIGGFELQHDLAGRGAAQAFVAEGGARDIPTQAFEFLPLLGAAPGVGMQAKTLDIAPSQLVACEGFPRIVQENRWRVMSRQRRSSFCR